jgi:4-hydroxyphenylacetate 3-monooxygenase
MGARTGREYIDALDERAIDVEIEGERSTGGVSRIPRLRNVIQTYGELFDLQHDDALRDVMTYVAPSGERVGMSFLQTSSGAARR